MAGESSRGPDGRGRSARTPSKAAAIAPLAEPKPEAGPVVHRPALSTMAEAMEFLYQRVNVERQRMTSLDPDVFKLDRMRALAEALGNPQRDFKSVHVAGSKGKGSVCEMVASIMQGCGYATGLYTSPHLVDLRERVRLNQVLIPEGEFLDGLAFVADRATDPAFEAQHGAATFFEIVTLLSFVYFARQAVDLAVLEVGLGGRLDATNIVTPEVCAITSIQLEHTNILGDTHEKIAREKAGIMKPGVPCITIPQRPGVLEVFREVANATNAPLLVVGEDIDFSYRMEGTPELGHHARVVLSTQRSNFEHIAVPLKGEHQALNGGLALAVVDRLRERGFDTPEGKVAQGLAKTPNLGRLEIVRTRPRVVVDGAHNPESVGALMKALGQNLKYDSLVVVFGCAADKNIVGMLRMLAHGADKVIFTKADNNARAVEPRDLQRRFQELSPKMALTAPTVAEALRTAMRAVHPDDLICCTGSFYVAGEAKKLIQTKAV
jgi:dihydrofolate synthase/folylpolyglutamate synthase